MDRLNLQSWLPNDLHSAISPLLVGFGRTVCLFIGSCCSECTLLVGKLCPSDKVGQTASPRKGRSLQAGPSPNIKLEGTGDVDITTEMIDEGTLSKTRQEVKEEHDNAQWYRTPRHVRDIGYYLLM